MGSEFTRVLIYTVIFLLLCGSCPSPSWSIPVNRPRDRWAPRAGPLAGKDFLTWVLKGGKLQRKEHPRSSVSTRVSITTVTEVPLTTTLSSVTELEADYGINTTYVPVTEVITTTQEPTTERTLMDDENDDNMHSAAESKIVQVVVSSSTSQSSPLPTNRYQALRPSLRLPPPTQESIFQAFYKAFSQPGSPYDRRPAPPRHKIIYPSTPGNRIYANRPTLVRPYKIQTATEQETSAPFFNEDVLLGGRVLGSDFSPQLPSVVNPTPSSSTTTTDDFQHMPSMNDTFNRYTPSSVPSFYPQPEINYATPEQPEKNYEQPEVNHELPEANYEQPEQVHHIRPTTSKPPIVDDAEGGSKKFGYVLEGGDAPVYGKYRVEERTPDGYIVGEYGVLHQDNGFLRGVRYTADGTINPELIYEALMKFLSL